MALRQKKQLPAAATHVNGRTLKSLGTDDVDALRIEATGIFRISALLEKAEAARVDRERRGVSDSVEARQQLEAPAFDTRLVGKRLEVCWPYKEGCKTVNIWASGTVKRIADGLTDTASARAKKILPAAVHCCSVWAWDADPTFDEVAGEKWLILLPNRWNRHVQYAWRFDPSELATPGGQKPPPSAPRVQPDVSDEEFLVTDDEMDEAA